MVDAREMGQQMALQQQAPRLGALGIEEPVGGEEAPARIGERAFERRGSGQEAPPPGAQHLLEFRGELAQGAASLPKIAQG